MTQQEEAKRRAARPNLSRLIVAGTICVLVIAGAGYYAFFLRPPSIGTGPAGPPVPREPFQSPWSSRPVLVLGLGDSMTAGYGASPGFSYFERLIKNPPGEFPDMEGICLSAVFPNLTARNLAVSGSTSIDCMERQIATLSLAEPDVVGIIVITTGGNDLIHFYGRTPPQDGAMYGATIEQAKPWIANFQRRLKSIIDTTTGLFPGGCYVFLGNIYDPSDGVGDPTAARLPPWEDALAILQAYNEVIAQCAREHPQVWLVDIHDQFLGHGVHCHQPWRKHYRSEDPHYWYYDNIEDPNDRGYDAIRRLFLLAMIGAFRETPVPERSPSSVENRGSVRLLPSRALSNGAFWWGLEDTAHERDTCVEAFRRRRQG